MNGFLAVAWIAAIATFGLIVLLVVLHRRTAAGGASGVVQPHDLPAAPASAIPFVAAATLVALGVAFYAGSQTGTVASAVTVSGSGCTADPTLHVERVVAAGSVTTISMTGASACSGHAVNLYVDGAAPLQAISAGDTTVWFTPALAAGAHAYVLTVGTFALGGDVTARTPLSIADLGTTGGALFGSLSALAGLIAAVIAIFKRA